VFVEVVEVVVVFKYFLLQQTDPSKPCFGTKHSSLTNSSEKKNQFIEFKFAK
jgi:hypothetical protein